MRTYLRAAVTAVLLFAAVPYLARVASVWGAWRPADPWEALGRSYAPALASTYADGWLAAAAALEQGRSVAEAQAVLQQTWQEGRVREFRLRVQPALARVLPEGAEPDGPASRAQVAAAWRAFAAGLGAGR